MNKDSFDRVHQFPCLLLNAGNCEIQTSFWGNDLFSPWGTQKPLHRIISYPPDEKLLNTNSLVWKMVRPAYNVNSYNLESWLHYVYLEDIKPLISYSSRIYIMYGHTYSKSIAQPGRVASPARRKLNRRNEYFPVRVRACEFGLARRVRQSRPASACSSPYSG